MWLGHWRRPSVLPPISTVAERPKLQKAIAQSGLMSRRAAEELIAQSRVTVDGRIAGIGERVDPGHQIVAIDGRPIPVSPGLVTYLLYKPVGVVSTADDPQGRPTVTDLVPAEPRVYPAGRLDADSEGLLLLTNDGTMADLVMHPRYGIDKTYLVVVAGGPGRWVQSLVNGVELDDGPAAARAARVVDSSKGQTMIEMVMGEGRNREIRRMCDVVGHQVLRLVRTGIGPIADRTLKAGSWRRLEPSELASLYAAADRSV